MGIFNPGGMVWDWIKKGVEQLLGRLKEVAAGLVGKVLATFGLTTVTFDAVLPNLKQFVQSQVGGLDGPVAQVLGYLEVGTAMSMILSALTIRMAWKVFIVPKSVADSLGGGH
ncbi:hypothetical protein AOT14_18690 [Stenotrophomonas acidaminiphila]|uniref:DUF2523 domain-containing protein n=1 Tax=Stenotrophomonas acidaminiphila TaxID=128780 RepID=A0A0S1AZP0_9GAMM|nr:DUF2523 domain-containing protein [Stenotrophomonas acidaminiphila]ALJ28246.1 hypothetical protein AOT14_18690 [Stenotrophomonas acidaminiphila]